MPPPAKKSNESMIIALVVLVVVLAIAYYAYSKCKLNKYLSTGHQKTGCPPGGTFVGAMAKDPHLVPLAFPVNDQGWLLNRGNYV